MRNPSAAEVAARRARQRPPDCRYHLLRGALVAGLPGLHGLDDARLARIEPDQTPHLPLRTPITPMP